MTVALASPSNQKKSSITATTADGQDVWAALEARGISHEFAVSLGLRVSKGGKRGRLEIPYYLDGKEINCKTRGLGADKFFYQEPDKQKIFYNQDIIAEWQKTGQPLLICEGELDCISALQAGYMAVSVPDGAPATKLGEGTRKYEYLEGFPNSGEVILCTDADGAGENLLHDLALRLGRKRCKWIKYPKGCKDLNDALRLFGVKGVKAAIDTAAWVEIDGLSLMSQLPPLSMPEYREGGSLPLKIRKGDFWIVTGIPSMGKTQVTNFLAHTTATQGWHVTFASFEQRPQTQHRYNLRSLYLDLPASIATDEQLAQADKWIDDHYSFITTPRDRTQSHDLFWLMDKMAAAVHRYGTDMFVIDPWNEVQHNFNNKEMTGTEYIRFAIMELKHFAEDYRVGMMIVAHPTKQQKQDGKLTIPTLYDIEDSRHWYNKADVGVIVHLQDDGNTLVRVAKSRYHDDIGKPGDYILSYDTRTKKFTSPSPIYSAYTGE
jgi:twinkle protein